jgi:hypothetical protein
MNNNYLDYRLQTFEQKYKKTYFQCRLLEGTNYNNAQMDSLKRKMSEKMVTISNSFPAKDEVHRVYYIEKH